MSKENAMQFMMMKDKDDSLKNALDAIMDKYERGKVSIDEWDKII